jgi:hypothetical protein
MRDFISIFIFEWEAGHGTLITGTGTGVGHDMAVGGAALIS